MAGHFLGERSRRCLDVMAWFKGLKFHMIAYTDMKGIFLLSKVGEVMA